MQQTRKALQNNISMRGQTSAEFMIILGVTVVVLLVAITLSQSQQSAVLAQKDTSDSINTINDLSSAAKEVYSQGEGSRKHVFVQIPSSYDPNSSFVANRTIKMRVSGSDYAATETFLVHGTLPSTSGGKWVWVVSEGNRVRVGDAMMSFDKNRIYLVMPSNSSATSSFNVTNIWTRSINISTQTTWSNSFVSMSGVPASFSLAVNASNFINLNFVSNANASGTYLGQITLNANDGAGNTESDDVPVTVIVLPPGLINSANDTMGPLITYMYQNPTPAIKNHDVEIYVNATDTLTGNSTIYSCQIQADNSGSWLNMLPQDGAYDSPTEMSFYNFTSGFSLGPHTLAAKCTDSKNNTGPPGYYYFNVSEADVLGPIVISMVKPDSATTLTNITIGGVATDAYTGNSNVAGCNVKVGSAGSWVATTPADGAWDSPTENFTYSIGSLAVGSYNIYYQCNDSLGNIGGIYNDSFGIVDVDLMIVLDRSGSMIENVTNATAGGTVTAASTGWSWVKNVTVVSANGDLANFSADLKSSVANCLSSYNATINGVQVATGNTTSTTYVTLTSSINVSSYSVPYQVSLWLKRNATGCTASNSLISVQQGPTKMASVKTAASSFVDIAGNNVQAGLVSYSTTATTDKQLAMMSTANQNALKTAINALNPSGSTCIECGLDNAAAELNSSRGRAGATRVVVFLTDGLSNTGNSINGAILCRNLNITVYTIGYGSDVNDTELTNVALLTGGDYYFAPNVQTLNSIFQSIGRH